jgi:hypothetical protein
VRAYLPPPSNGHGFDLHLAHNSMDGRPAVRHAYDGNRDAAA